MNCREFDGAPCLKTDKKRIFQSCGSRHRRWSTVCAEEVSRVDQWRWAELLSGLRSARRRRGRNNRAARIAIPVAAVMALGVTVGIVVGASGHNTPRLHSAASSGPAGGSPAATGCQMINSLNLGAFVQATILNPHTGALYVYNPLVITAGTTPAVKPVVPKLPKNA